MLRILSEQTLEIGILCLLHRVAEGVWSCKMDQIKADLKGNWYQLSRKKIAQQIVHGSKYDWTKRRPEV